MRNRQSLYTVLLFVLIIGLIAGAWALSNRGEGSEPAASNAANLPAAEDQDAPPEEAEDASVEPDQPADVGIETDIPSLHTLYADKFDLGVAIAAYQTEGRYSELVKKHYNTIVAGNEMKPGSLQPVEDFFDWDAADKMVKFAKDNGLKVRFHTLVWHQQTAAWMFREPAGVEMRPTEENKKLLLERLETHIRTVVDRYKNDITDWDVVNEVIDENEPDGMRRSKWYEITGKDYIEVAFRVAREAAGPDARLYINDYNTHIPKKRDAIFDLVQELKDKGVPIDGVGHQTHISLYYPPLDEIRSSIEKFASIGLDNQITEMDISIYANDTDTYTEVPEEVLIRLAHRYKELFDLFVELQDKISSVVLWGTDDGNSWLRSFPIVRINMPLPFDEHLKAKDAYWALVDPSRVPPLPAAEPPIEIGEKKRAAAMRGVPVIDGEWDEVWNQAEVIATDVWVEGNDGAQAKVRTLWDDGHLYVYAEVTDSLLSKASANVWEQDSFEIFIDQNFGQTAAYEGDDGQYRVNFENEQSYNGIASADNFVTATKITEGGYIVEAALKLDAELIRGGAVIGYDVQVNDDRDGDGVRDSVSIWNDPTGQSYQNTTNFGSLELKE